MRTLETLRDAIRSWELAPKATPSDDLVDRIFLAVSNTDVSPAKLRNRRLENRRWVVGLSATAATALAITIQFGANRSRPVPWFQGSDPNPPPGRIDRRPTVSADLFALNQALTDASDATWDLAYAASGPALRLGRRVFDHPAGSNTGPTDSEANTRMDILSTGTPGEVVSEALNQFGEGISKGVRPLSNSARQALDFLQSNDQQHDGPIELPPTHPDSRGA